MASPNPAAPLWDGFKMYISPDAYTFEPISATAANTQILTIDRVKGDVTVKPTLDMDSSRREKVMNVHGILGLIRLHSYEFLIVITSRTKTSTLLSSTIYQATDFRVFPIASDAKPSLLQHPIEKSLLALLKAHLYSAPFYFSYDYDLTSSMQRQATVGNQDPIWKRADERFFWNRHLQTRLIDSCTPSSDPSKFILPVVMGFLEIKTSTLNGRDLVFGLIARRSRHRPGTRYFSRGIDSKGNVSNFNETEQFIIMDPKEEGDTIGKIKGKLRFSYVQTRGSVPVYWAEVNNLRYKPDLLIMDKPETLEATTAHFKQQTEIYGDVYLVNLVNQKGYEKPVKEAFERVVENLGNNQVHYTYYDFHHECKGMKFEKVQELIQRLEQKGLEGDDYFYQDINRPNPNVRQQKAVVRTNCMDCLDRTNVVQSMLGRWVLNDQLRSAGVISKDDKVENHTEFMFMFRNVWADHADTVSKAYSGTGALKTDFTRTGKRSTEGALQDGINSVTRYVKNNFFDGSRQDAYDLFSGAWEPTGKTPHPDKRDILVRAMPYILLFSLLFALAGLILPRASDAMPLGYFISLCILIALASGYYMVERGLEYVDWPTLNRPEESMYYEGPGYSSGRKGRAAVKGKYGKNSKAKYTSQVEIKEGNVGRRGYDEKRD